MDATEVLVDLYDRLPDLVAAAVDGLTPEQLVAVPEDEANTVGWLVWHLTRVQDHHVADLLGTEQLWVSGSWAAKFGLTPDPSNTGYGHDAGQVASVRPADWKTLVDYYGAVHQRTTSMLQSLTPEKLDRVVDRRWDPPVTLGVRLVSVADDSLQHVGQAAYVRGVLTR